MEWSGVSYEGSTLPTVLEAGDGAESPDGRSGTCNPVGLCTVNCWERNGEAPKVIWPLRQKRIGEFAATDCSWNLWCRSVEVQSLADEKIAGGAQGKGWRAAPTSGDGAGPRPDTFLLLVERRPRVERLFGAVWTPAGVLGEGMRLVRELTSRTTRRIPADRVVGQYALESIPRQIEVLSSAQNRMSCVGLVDDMVRSPVVARVEDCQVV